MVIGMGDDPALGEYERLLMSTKTTARRELVLLHPNKNIAPGSTREWLKVGTIHLCQLGRAIKIFTFVEPTLDPRTYSC